MYYMSQGSACPLNPNEAASTAIRVSPHLCIGCKLNLTVLL